MSFGDVNTWLQNFIVYWLIRNCFVPEVETFFGDIANNTTLKTTGSSFPQDKHSPTFYCLEYSSSGCRSRIRNNTRSQSQNFLSDSESRIGSFFTLHSLSWEFLLKWYTFFWTFCWNRILAVHHDFHWLLQNCNSQTTFNHSLYVK